MNLPRSGTAALVLVVLLTPSAAPANPASAALREKAALQFYNLDRDEAMATFRQAVSADPEDAAAYRGLAAALWLSISYKRGNMTVDEYIGRVSKPKGTMAPPPPETAAAFKDALDKAITLARAGINQNPRDADAHYQLGAAIGLRASYVATIEGGLGSAFRAAREAFNEHEEVLVLDPARKDAGLIVGTYRYIVATLALPMRLMAYAVGFGGDKEKGLRLIQDASIYHGDNREDARFALILMYNREKRYDDALKQLADLRERYPRNRLIWLESGATSLRAGRAVEAESLLDEGMRRFAHDERPRMFGEEALWRYKRGAARAALGRPTDAETDLRAALEKEGRPWVHGRAHLELGKLALKNGRRDQANADLRAALQLCESDNDPVYAEEARRLLK